MTTPVTHELTAEDLHAMRAWLTDCFESQAEEVEEATDAAVVRGVERHYVGGVCAFLLAEGTITPSAVVPPVGAPEHVQGRLTSW